MGKLRLSLLKDRLEQYKCDSSEAVHFKLVRKESDLEDNSNVFHPDMSHQIFGENEQIFGYKDLRIEMYFSAASLSTYINLWYLDKITPQKFDGVSADDVVQRIAEKIPPGYYTNIDEFMKTVAKDAEFKPFGELLHAYTVKTKESKSRKFEVYKTGIESPGFRDFHSRLEPFLLWYVDAASYIDIDDERWTYYLVFEKYTSNGNPHYATVGYMTVYNYYAYPEKVRPRISQVLILPPYQKQGHGAELLQTFYNDVTSRKDVLDITVEDPNDGFQRLRDYVDAKNCLKLEAFKPEYLKKGFQLQMSKDAQDKLKLNKKQARRIYEILRLKSTNMANDAEYKSYRLNVKKRLNAPFQKSGRDMSKWHHVLQANELSATIDNLTEEQRMTYLEKEFDDLVTQYGKTIDRLSIS